VTADYGVKLSEEVQTALLDVAVMYRDHVAGLAMDRASASREAWAAAICC
jgi:C4-dicarboxylate-binding protein DctP